METTINWKITDVDGVPKARICTTKKYTTVECADMFLCFDGESIFEIHFSFEDGSEDEWFRKHIVKYIRFSDIQKPI